MTDIAPDTENQASDEKIVEMVARAICIAEGDDPDVVVMQYEPQRTKTGFIVVGDRDHAVPRWCWSILAAQQALKCHRDMLLAAGFVIVPREPTDDMKEAGIAPGNYLPTEIWSAMIDAAPRRGMP